MILGGYGPRSVWNRRTPNKECRMLKGGYWLRCQDRSPEDNEKEQWKPVPQLFLVVH